MEEHHITVPRTARYHTLGRADQARELWLVLHGYGQLARFFLRHFEGLEEGRLIAAPEGLSRYYTDDAHSRVGATWMTREDRATEIADQANYLNALANHLIMTCPPGTALHVLGFSQGVATAFRWWPKAAPAIAKLVLWAGNLPSDLDLGPMAHTDRPTELVLVHGENDPITGEPVVARNAALLYHAGMPHHIIRYPGGHGLDRLILKRVVTGATA